MKEATGRTRNIGQKQALDAGKGLSLFIVAGPGTGKTATLTMRIHELIFVESLSPSGILATTFTKKAAQEHRSRLLSWGYAVQEHLLTKEKLSKIDPLWLEGVDINQVRTGTIDSICEEILRDFRDLDRGLTLRWSKSHKCELVYEDMHYPPEGFLGLSICIANRYDPYSLHSGQSYNIET